MTCSAWKSAAVAICLFTTAASAQHHTIRFFTSNGIAPSLEAFAFSPDGKLLAVTTGDGIVSIVSVKEGDFQQRLQFSAFDVAFSPDGQNVLMLGQRDTRLLNIASKSQTQVNWKLPTGSIGIRMEQKAGKLQFSNIIDGGPAALSGEIKVGDELIGITQHGKHVSLLGSSVSDALAHMRGFTGASLVLHLIPTGSAQPKEVRLIRAPGVTEGDTIRFPPTTPIPALPHACITAVNKTFAIVSADKGHPLSALSPIELESYGMYALSANGQRFGLTAKYLGESSVTAVEIFDVSTGERTHFTRLPRHGYSGAAFSPDGKLFVAADYDRLNVFSLEESVLRTPIMLTRNMTIVPPEPSIASQSPAAKAAAAVQDEVGPLVSRQHDKALSSIDVTRDEIAAIGTPVGTIEAWSLSSGDYLGDYLGQEFATGKPTEDVAFSPNGEWLASYSEGTLHLMNVAQKRWEKESADSQSE